MARVNPFLKFMGPEDHLQHQFTTWLDWQHPKLKYHHSPDAGKRSLFEQYKFKYLGSDSGFLDLIFPELLHAIELKVKPNKPTKDQLEWIEYLKGVGWSVDVCYTFEEAVASLKAAIKKAEDNFY